MSENIVRLFPVSTEDTDITELRAVETLANESRAEIGRRMLALQEKRGKKGWKEWVETNCARPYGFYNDCMVECITGQSPQQRKNVAEEQRVRERELNVESKQSVKTSFGAGTDKARPLVRPFVEKGEPVPRKQFEGVSEKEITNAVLVERGRQEGIRETQQNEPIDPSVLGKTAQERFEALEKRLRAQLEREFDDRVMIAVEKHINEYLLPHYKERLEKAEAILGVGMPFTNAEYRMLLAKTHPDKGGDPTVFQLLKSKEVLLRSEEKERPLSSALPTSLAELLAMKKTKR